jgi:hypothetical protein
MSANGVFTNLFTSKRNRKLLGGRFTTANTAAPTTPIGDGVAARTGTGVFTVTLGKKYSLSEGVTFSITGAAQSVSGVYDPATGVITFTVSNVSGAAAADTTGLIVSWHGIFSDRVS